MYSDFLWLGGINYVWGLGKCEFIINPCIFALNLGSVKGVHFCWHFVLLEY